MKTTVKGIVGMLLLFVAIATYGKPGSASVNTSGLQLVPQNEIPSFGTFWIEGPNGLTAPLPFLPLNLSDAPVYSLGDGQFLVDARNSEDPGVVCNAVA